jgi:hypothetical protein
MEAQPAADRVAARRVAWALQWPGDSHLNGPVGSAQDLDPMGLSQT